MSAAREYKNPEEYVTLVSDLTEPEKQKRRELWTVANFGRTEPGTPAPAKQDAAPPKPMTVADRDEFMRRAKNDKALARKMAIEAGFDVSVGK